MKDRPAEFANVVVRFGDKVLLDYAREIVIPAILDQEHERKYGKSRFFFIDQKLIEVKGKTKKLGVIVGRFVKDTILTSSQEWDRGSKTIVTKERSMPTAPSAVFALILNNHRMVYLKETPHSPPLKSFEATLAGALAKHHELFLDKQIEDKYSQWNEMPKKQQLSILRKLLEETPYPEVSALPLSSVSNVADYINKFKCLQEITVTLGKTNQNIESSAFLRSFRGSSERLGTTKAKASFSNKETGLDREASTHFAASATEQGMNEIEVKGEDLSGDPVKGTNENMKVTVSVPIEEGRMDTGTLAHRLVEKYIHMEEMDILRKPDDNDAINQAVSTIIGRKE